MTSSVNDLYRLGVRSADELVMMQHGQQGRRFRERGGRLPIAEGVTSLAVAVALLVALVAAPADAQRRVEIYKVQHRIAEEMRPLAETAMGSAAGVTLDRGTNSLVLIGDPEAVAGTLALLAHMDRAPRTVVIRYESMHASELDARGYEIHWRESSGDFRIGNVRERSLADSSVDLRADDAMRRLTDSFTSTMRVTEGGRTRIETGSIVPFGVAGPSGASIEFVDASTGFEAGARILGDGRVEIDLASFAAEPPGADGSIASTLGSTQLVLKPGDTTAVAGLDRGRDGERTKRFGSARSGTRREGALWLLRVEVE
jgi:hypothetical protein